MRKLAFCMCENKDADQLCGTAQLISAFVFATRIVQSLCLLNPKFQASICISVTAQPGLCGTWSETPKTGFLTMRLIFKNILIHCYLYYLVLYLAVEMLTSGFGPRKKYFFMINA